MPPKQIDEWADMFEEKEARRYKAEEEDTIDYQLDDII